MNTPTTRRERTIASLVIALGTAGVFAPFSLFLAGVLLCCGALMVLAGVL